MEIDPESESSQSISELIMLANKAALNRIIRKYGNRRQGTVVGVEDARRDAFSFILLASAAMKIDAYNNPGSTTENTLLSYTANLDIALREASSGNWLPMKQHLQSFGMTTRKESTTTVKESTEHEALAAINLANSLGG